MTTHPYPTLVATPMLYQCLSLHRRRDRRFFVEQTAPPEVLSKLEFIEAIDGRGIAQDRAARWRTAPSSYAINLGKRLALRRFLRTEAQALVLFEDDVCFKAGFMEEFDRLLRAVPDDWGMLFLGGEDKHKEPPQEAGPDLLRCRRVHHNHAWVIRRWCAPLILHALNRKPFSHAYSDQTIGALQKTIPTYAPGKWIAFQRTSASDNGFGLAGSLARPLPQRMRPWMHEDETALLQCAIKADMRVLEWGSGGSTLLLAHLVGKGGRVHSIEHDAGWAARVREAAEAEGLQDNLHLHHVPAGYGSLPVAKARPRQFVRYVAKALELGVPQPFDACLVDGRDRVACALAAAQVLRPGALLFFHDFAAADRGRYREYLPELLALYRLRFEITHTPQTMAVFERLPGS